MQGIPICAYQAELDEKVEIINALQERYNDGRRKTFYYQAVNPPELSGVVAIMERIFDTAVHRSILFSGNSFS